MMQVVLLRSFWASLVVLLLSGCADHAALQQQVRSDPAAVSLAHAATSVSHTLANLAEIEQAASPTPPLHQPPDPASYGMAGLVSIDWTGPVEPLVQRIAQATNYKLRVLGSAPPIPVMVSVTARQESLGTLLRNVGYQCGKRAHVVIFPNTKVIELRYAHT